MAARIPEGSEQDGKITEMLIAQPRIQTKLGQKAHFSISNAAGNDGPKTLGVKVDVIAPKAASDLAWCMVAMTQGDLERPTEEFPA